MTAMAASGLRSRMESLDLLANNMANASTGGYKADREFYSLYTAPEAQDADSTTTMPIVQQHWTDLSQGTHRQYRQLARRRPERTRLLQRIRSGRDLVYP